MKRIVDADPIQICTTNACVLECSNCTHLVGHAKKPYMMPLEYFKKVVESLKGTPTMVGLIGGEVTLHPDFVKQCDILLEAFPRKQLGLWSVFPDKFRHYREVICRTFGNILLNNHSRSDIMHAPMLVASGEYFDNQAEVRAAAWNCWVQNGWSPGITPKGAFFCEVAGELDYLFEGPGGWDISEPKWWLKTPLDYLEQVDRYCNKCGGCLPFARRSSQDNRDDISEGNLKLLEGKSGKIKQGKIVVHKQGEFPLDKNEADPKTGAGRYPDQSPYKDMEYRQGIAAQYGIVLTINERGYWEPHLKEDMPEVIPPKPSLFNILSSAYTGRDAAHVR